MSDFQHINPVALQLPAGAIVEELNQVVREHGTVVLTAEPGAGKSTLLPLTLPGRIVMIEPRRLAARQVAERLAENIGEKAGETVGYRVRFESRVGKETRLEVVTEGVMMRRLMQDTLLEGVDMVIFDEFHERSLTSDTVLALVRQLQQLVRPELKILIMSATLDTQTICQALDAPLVQCRGRMFPVEIRRVAREQEAMDVESVSRDVCRVISRALREDEGDVLVFLPGQGEILRCAEMLEASLSSSTSLTSSTSPTNLTSSTSPTSPTSLTSLTRVYPLYGLLPPAEQRRAIAPSRPGERKVVLATSIAETSLTIEGVRVVVDSGLCRRMVYDPQNGLSHLETVRISRDMAEQRKGRAGRVAPGVCYQLWNTAQDHQMAENRRPEVLDADLSGTMLDIMSWGEPDMESLPWLTMPPHGNVLQARELLQSLGALDVLNHTSSISALGRKMAQFPCHPRISRMLLQARDDREQAVACDLAALLEEKDPMAEQNDVDINARLERLRQACKNKFTNSLILDNKRWSRISQVAEQYRRLLKVREPDASLPLSRGSWWGSVGRLLATAYPERIGQQRGNGLFWLSGGGNARIEQKDQLAGADWIVVASMNPQTGRVFLASQADANEMVTKPYAHLSWNSKEGCIVAQEEQRVGRLVVKQKPLRDVPTGDVYRLLATAAQKEGLSMFTFDDEVQRLQRRLATVGEWRPELDLPDVGTEAVLARAEEWLPMYAGRATTSAELRRLSMQEIIWSLLTYDQQQAVERLAPTHLQLPGGKRVRVDYRAGAEAPVVSARLEDCFGLLDTPRVNDGRQAVLMELLSPGYKPVQLTRDLRNFWQTTYFEVRKELRRRYPKHPWPENPV